MGRKPGEAAQSLSLEVFKTCLDAALSRLVRPPGGSSWIQQLEPEMSGPDVQASLN